jgi:hypothetical protein
MSTTTVTHRRFTHTPTTLTLLWLTVSLPLVLWDAGYVLGRPHTMPGGKWHAPLWTPYELYGRTDYVYGMAGSQPGEGFNGAQTVMNLVETALYVAYLATVWPYGLFQGRRVAGAQAGKAVLLGYSAAVMTVAKTLLYWANEYFSGFKNIGHNEAWDLFWLWIVPK